MNAQRMSDIAIAVVLLLLCLPVLVFASLILAIEQARIPFQSLDRTTRSGRQVRLYRLRVMEMTPFGLKSTAVGALVQRLYLDQVPMLLNVLKGDLTLAGCGHEAIASLRVLAERPFS